MRAFVFVCVLCVHVCVCVCVILCASVSGVVFVTKPVCLECIYVFNIIISAQKHSQAAEERADGSKTCDTSVTATVATAGANSAGASTYYNTDFFGFIA